MPHRCRTNKAGALNRDPRHKHAVAVVSIDPKIAYEIAFTNFQLDLRRLGNHRFDRRKPLAGSALQREKPVSQRHVLTGFVRSITFCESPSYKSVFQHLLLCARGQNCEESARKHKQYRDSHTSPPDTVRVIVLAALRKKGNTIKPDEYSGGTAKRSTPYAARP